MLLLFGALKNPTSCTEIGLPITEHILCSDNYFMVELRGIEPLSKHQFI
nr:MAG TPA_asm: hypothetical protein [Caudoviricetes sp.]